MFCERFDTRLLHNGLHQLLVGLPTGVWGFSLAWVVEHPVVLGQKWLLSKHFNILDLLQDPGPEEWDGQYNCVMFVVGRFTVDSLPQRANLQKLRFSNFVGLDFVGSFGYDTVSPCVRALCTPTVGVLSTTPDRGIDTDYVASNFSPGKILVFSIRDRHPLRGESRVVFEFSNLFD